MPTDHYSAIDEGLRRLSSPDQRALAVALAQLTVPFARLGSQSEVPLGMERAFQAIRADADLQTNDAARHSLIQSPWMALDEEPSGLDWYAHRACCAWIYAADAVTTAPGDGVRQAFAVVDDLLDQAASDLNEPSLNDTLHKCLTPNDPRLVTLRVAIEDAVQRLPR